MRLWLAEGAIAGGIVNYSIGFATDLSNRIHPSCGYLFIFGIAYFTIFAGMFGFGGASYFDIGLCQCDTFSLSAKRSHYKRNAIYGINSFFPWSGTAFALRPRVYYWRWTTRKALGLTACFAGAGQLSQSLAHYYLMAYGAAPSLLLLCSWIGLTVACRKHSTLLFYATAIFIAVLSGVVIKNMPLFMIGALIFWPYATYHVFYQADFDKAGEGFREGDRPVRKPSSA